MVVDGLKGNDVDLVSLDHCEEVPSHLTDLDPAAQNYDSCLVTLDTGRGRYLNDVRTEGGGSKNCSILGTNSTDRLREMQMKGGGGGVKKSENIADVLCTCPLR